MDQALPANWRIDDLEIENLRIIQDPDSFCFGMDAVLLAHFARPKSSDSVLDLGTGNGILPLLVFGLYQPMRIVGIEIQPGFVDMAQRSVKLNGLEKHIHLLCGDYRDEKLLRSLGCFHLVVANPPYHPVGSGDMCQDRSDCIARFELTSTLGDVLRAAAILNDGGRFCMVHLPRRLPEVIETMQKFKLTPKRLLFVHPHVHKNASLVLIEGIKNASAGLTVCAPIVVHEADGRFTSQMQEIYHGGRLI